MENLSNKDINAVLELEDHTGMYMEVPDLDHMFHTLERPPMMINEQDVSTQESKDRLKELLITNYTSDTLDPTPSCRCRNPSLLGGQHLNKICPICNTAVTPVTEKEIEPSFWMKVPKGVKGFILPAFWAILKDNFSVKSFCTISWLVDKSYKPKVRDEVKINHLMKLNLPRGLNNFIDNFDMIFEVLVNDRKLCKLKRKDEVRIEFLKRYVEENRGKLFPKYIPLPTTLTFINESNPTGTYCDGNITFALDAISTICTLSAPGAEVVTKQHIKENKVFKVIKQLTEYYSKIYDKSLGSKKGQLRKHVFGARGPWTARSVITSIHGPHDHRELWIPWAMAVTLFKVHLFSKLLRLDYTYNQAVKLINDHTMTYHHLLDDLMTDILYEREVEYIEPNEVCVEPIQDIPGAIVTLGRNPTLLRGSIAGLTITKIKTNVNDFTISLSVNVLKALNADFDGRFCHLKTSLIAGTPLEL